MIRVTIHGLSLPMYVVHKAILMTEIHLLVLIHGMWGNPTHLAHMDKIIREVKSSSENTASDEPELAVLVAKTNRDESTYDGIDWGGERVTQEVELLFVWFSFILFLTPSKILEDVQHYESQGKKVTRFSVMGYSLGGLLARYVVGYVMPIPRCALWADTVLRILHQNKFFEKVKPVNFNTVATPHIGIPKFPSTLSAITNYIGPRFLSRTGEQFFCVDTWSPRGRPLLDVLADPGQHIHNSFSQSIEDSEYAHRPHFLSGPLALS